MILSRPNGMMLIAALGMISVLALPVPADPDEIDVSTAPTAPLTINMIVHARSDPSQEADSMGKQMFNSGQPPPLGPVEPPTSASGPPVNPLYRQQRASVNSVQPSSSQQRAMENSGVRCPIPPPGGRKFKRKPGTNDLNIPQKISRIELSPLYRHDTELQHYLKINLFDTLTDAFEKKQTVTRNKVLMPLLNGYLILAEAEREVKDEIKRIQELEIYDQCKEVYGPLIERIEKKRLEPNDMINFGLADPNRHGYEGHSILGGILKSDQPFSSSYLIARLYEEVHPLPHQ
ncbi:hypothetical protein C8R42DRAFT_646889 [Lentinula raphanica]|nr:hypothetical protein C8R42DRAFT_646889 [Lentinula raphanica]